jgi:hypothetical protein
MAKQKTPKAPFYNKGKSAMLENVDVYSSKKEKDTRSKSPMSSMAS